MEGGSNGVPCGTRRGPGLSQRPLEQMGSISYFVTPSFHCAMPCRAVSFLRHPRTCDLFRRYISRFNVPLPLGAQRTFNAHSCSLFRVHLPLVILLAPLPGIASFQAFSSPADICPLRRRNNATKWSLPGLFIGWQITRIHFDHCRVQN